MGNPMTDHWTTFERDKGQIVTWPYRYDPDSDRIILRVHDGCDGTVSYYSAPCPDDVTWTGAEGVRPFDSQGFRSAANPFDD